MNIWKKIKKIFFTSLFLSFLIEKKSVFAEWEGILAGCGDTSVIRNGAFTFECIPNIIATATNSLFTLIGPIAVVMIIIGSFKLALGSVDSDKQKGKDIIQMGIIGLIVAIFARFIVLFIIDNI